MRDRREPVVVLVGHGSRLPAVEADLAALAGAVSALTGLESVESCGPASLGATLDRVAGRGAVQILVQPYFLGVVGALASRLRERVREWQRLHPGHLAQVGSALGTHPLVTTVLADAALRALDGRPGVLLLVGHGSPEPAWSRALQVHRGRLERLGLFDAVRVAFLAHQKPDVVESLDASGGEVAVVPFFLGRGVHTSVELPHLLRAARPPVERLHLASFWADDPRIAMAVSDRILGSLSTGRPPCVPEGNRMVAFRAWAGHVYAQPRGCTCPRPSPTASRRRSSSRLPGPVSGAP